MKKTINTRKTSSISAIVPLFDEEKNIAKIIKFLLKNPLISEIIAVNDGSTDNSLEILKKFSKDIKIITYKKNRGKGYALAQGIKKANGEIVLFLDADLINLTRKHIKAILLPIINKKKRAVLGYGTPGFFSNRSLVINVTGQRAYYRKDLIPYLKKISKTKYGVEIYLSSLFDKKDTKMVPLVGLTHIWKHKKHNPQKAIKQYIIMGTEIAQEIGKREIRQRLALNKITKIKNLKFIKEEIYEIKNKPSALYLPVNKKIQHYYKIINEIFFDF